MTAWDVSTAEWVQARSVADEESAPCGLFLSPDGSKMYIVGYGGDEVNEYSLSTPWDISSETWVRARDVSAEEAGPVGLFFKPDGSKMYIVGFLGSEVNEYSLSTPWDISSETWVRALDVSGKETQPNGVVFKPDGSRMYIVGSEGDDVNEYSLGTSWNVSTETWIRARSVVAEEPAPTGMFFKPDGSKMYIIGPTGIEVNEYSLSTPWDISSETWVRAFDVSGEEAVPRDVFFKNDGSKMYIVGTGGDEVNEYNLPIIGAKIPVIIHHLQEQGIL